MSSGCSTEHIVYQTQVVSVDPSFFAPCKVEPVAEGATDYQEAFYAVSGAYISTAEHVAKCNARSAEGVLLMERQKERYETLTK